MRRSVRGIFAGALIAWGLFACRGSGAARLEGHWKGTRADGVAIAMRRLSILDIAGGHQPMWSESGQHAVVFNGEIYNWQMLRNILVKHGHAFRTERSDTEVLVHGYEQWGDGLFARLNGMFAVIVWDKLNRALVVARDFSG